MSLKPLILQKEALAEIEEASVYYRQQGGYTLEMRFLRQFEATVSGIRCRPAAGSLRYSELTDLEGLRFQQTKRFPYLIFYVEYADRIEFGASFTGGVTSGDC